jgi:hypothetical protein
MLLKLLKLSIIINGVNIIKSLLLEAFGDTVNNEGFKNGLKDLLVPFHGHKMVTGLTTSVDRCTFIKSRKV